MIASDMKYEARSMKQVTRLGIVDPHDLSRNGILMLLTRANIAVEVEAIFADLAGVLAYLTDHQIQILLLNDDLPHTADIGGVLRQLTDQFPGLAVLVLSAKYVQHVISNGAQGFVYKEDRLQEALPLGIETVRSGYIYISPKASALPYNRSIQRPPEHFNHTDVEVLRMLAYGHTVQEIAAKLALAQRSIYRIRTKLRTLLEVRTNEQIVDAARKRGLLDTK